MTIIADDTELAAYLAKAAGSLVLEMRDTSGLVAKELGNAGDRTANQFLIHALGAQRPDDGLLSEESKDTDARLSKSRVWIIDPVDGTREYSEGRSDWAVHVALAIDGAPVIGAVALPALDLVLRTDQPAIIQPDPMKAFTAKAFNHRNPFARAHGQGCHQFTRWQVGQQLPHKGDGLAEFRHANA